jgi:DNA polymerase III sliding clamp (beta) subunit (PCNA family)
MKFDPKVRPEVFASKDETRTHLVNVHLDLEAKRLVATDGHRLIATPVEDVEADHGGPITAAALAEARKLTTRKRGGHEARLGANGALTLLNGATFPRPEPEQFPDWQRVVPSWRTALTIVSEDFTAPRTIGVNAKYLAGVFEAIGDGQVDMTVRGELDPIEFRFTGELGETVMVVMPMRR